MSSENQGLPASRVETIATAFRHELAAMRNHWWWFLLLGIALVVFGTIALGSAVFVTEIAVELFGILLLVGGVFQIVGSFWAGRWSGLLFQLLIGILYVVTGHVILAAPESAAESLTLVVALFLLISGIFRIVAALLVQFHDWGWVLLNGVVTLMLGLLILKQWPASGLFAIGLFVGIDMIFNGWAWVMFSLGLRATTPALAHSAADAGKQTP